MTDIDNAARDEVLFSFQLAHPQPAPADVAEWIRRHPAMRVPIMEHAASLLEAAHDGEGDEQATGEMLARGRSVTLDLSFRLEQAVRVASAGESGVRVPRASFEDLMHASGKGVPVLARELDVGRGVLSDVVSGRMAPPMGRRLADALSRALGASAEIVASAFEQALAMPVLGRARTSGIPEARRRSYVEIVRDDPVMSVERKAYWLEE